MQHSKQAAKLTFTLLVTASDSQWYLANKEMVTPKEMKKKKKPKPEGAYWSNSPWVF